MIDGSSWRIALLAMVLIAPTVAAAPPAPILTSPSSTDGQEISDLALDPTGQFAMAVVVADTQNVGGGILGSGSPVGPSKPDVYTCDFAPVTSSASAQSCIAARHRNDPTTGTLAQSVAATSFRPLGSSGITARYAVGGPTTKVSFWSSTEQSSRWEANVPGEQPVINVSITPNGTRLIAATDAAIGASSRLFVYDTAQTSGLLKWEFNLTDAEGQRNGVRVRDMEHPRTGRYLVVGTSPSSGSTNGALLFFDAHDDARPSAPAGKAAVAGSVTDVEVSHNGNALVVGTSTAIYYFELPHGLPDPQRLPWSRSPSAAGASAVAISGDGERFAAAFGETIHFYRHINDSRIAEEIGQGYATGAPVADLAFDRSGRLLVAVSGNKVFGFAANQTSPIWSFDATQASNGGLDGPLRKVELSEGADRLVVAGKTKIMPYQTRAAATLASTGNTTITGIPGTSIRETLRVTNTGSIEDEFSFRVTRPVGWTGANPEPVALLPDGPTHDGSRLVNMTIEVPPGHEPGRFPVTIDVFSSAMRNASRTNDERIATLQLNLVVPRSVSIAIEPGEERFNMVKGGEKVLPVTFRNTGNAGGLVNLSVQQEVTRGSPWNARLEETQLDLGAGNEQTVNLVIEAPADGASGDRNTLTIVAREGAYESKRSVTAYIEPEFGAELTANNETLEFTQRAPRVISIDVHNTGNTDDVYNLSYQVSEGSASEWKITLGAETVEVPRGQTRKVGVTVEPLVATPQTATLTIRAASQGSLGGDEGSVGIGLLYREPDREEDDNSFIPGPSPALVLAVIALAGIVRRATGGRRG